MKKNKRIQADSESERLLSEEIDITKRRVGGA
jgi:hypothetical protein